MPAHARSHFGNREPAQESRFLRRIGRQDVLQCGERCQQSGVQIHHGVKAMIKLRKVTKRIREWFRRDDDDQGGGAAPATVPMLFALLIPQGQV